MQIHVMQSLPFGDEKTGAQLYGSLQKYQTMYALFAPTVQFVEAPQKSAFVEYLRYVESIAEHGRPVFLQIECHGTERGLNLGHLDFISWRELTPYLTRINEKTNMNLYLMMAACFGAYGTYILAADRPAACRAIIGPSLKIYPTELLAAMESFYETLFRTGDGTDALNAMLQNKLREGEFCAINTYYYFVQSLSQIVETILVQRGFTREQFLKLNSPSYIKLITSHVASCGEALRKLHSIFFMTAKHPVNCETFPVTLEDLVRHIVKNDPGVSPDLWH
jgi:hypothetical protein